MAANTNTANFNTTAAVIPGNLSPNSPNQSNRAMKAASSPWTEMFRGENDPIAGISLTPSSSSSSPPSTALTEPPVGTEDEEEGVESENAGPNGNAGKKTAWNKPSNADAKVGPVMGTNKWPALSESAKVPSKSSSDSPRALSDGSSSSPSDAPVSQGNGSVLSSPTQKPVSNNSNTSLNMTPNHITPTRQKSMRRNSNISASNGGLSQSLPQGPVVESPVNSPSSRNHVQRSGFVSQSHTGGNDHPHPRNSYRHRNGGPHPRGDGSHHQNFGGRRNQDHGSHEWSGRNFNNRDAYMQPRAAPRVMRHPPPPPVPNTIPFIAHTPMRPFGTPMGYSDMASLYMVPAAPPDSLRGFSFVAPMPPVFFPAPEPHDNQLHASIVNQIDYYFSNENLIKDTYLRQNMDEQGWVPIKLIAGFKKVTLLTDNSQLITDALQSSTVVEVLGDKVRKRNNWMQWIMPPSVQFPTISGQDTLVACVQNISLDQSNTNQSGAMSQEDSNDGGLSGRSSFVDFVNQPELYNSGGSAIGAQVGPANNSN
ncbi:la-related protein 1C-like [Hibiscus syriacus]|uniref:la-related protein 1C-like n=1 Tax=Hibiscus syriacus TaxID=106335 RepID=UPI0019211006|nr:la-related protein 1C-like [Hibiscus syriacus]